MLAFSQTPAAGGRQRWTGGVYKSVRLFLLPLALARPHYLLGRGRPSLCGVRGIEHLLGPPVSHAHDVLVILGTLDTAVLLEQKVLELGWRLAVYRRNGVRKPFCA